MLNRLRARSTRAQSATPEGMRLYAIGDVHGRDDALDDLLNTIADDMELITDKTVKLIFLGDYVDRGLGSRTVIDRLAELKASTEGLHFLKGNHEDAMLSFLGDSSVGHVWFEYGGIETLRSYGVRSVKTAGDTGAFEEARRDLIERIPQAHLEFLQTLEVTTSYGDYFFTHAGARPGVPLDEQDEEDLLWIRDEFLSSGNHFEKVIVHGHTPSEAPQDLSWRIGVDTGAYVTGRLTAVVLDGTDRRFLFSS